jgi:hypothetical protein
VSLCKYRDPSGIYNTVQEWLRSQNAKQRKTYNCVSLAKSHKLLNEHEVWMSETNVLSTPLSSQHHSK